LLFVIDSGLRRANFGGQKPRAFVPG